MKYTLEFDMPEDDYEHRCHIHGAAAFNTLGTINEYIRSQLRYQDLRDKEKCYLEAIRDLAWEGLKLVEDV